MTTGLTSDSQQWIPGESGMYLQSNVQYRIVLLTKWVFQDKSEIKMYLGKSKRKISTNLSSLKEFQAEEKSEMKR